MANPPTLQKTLIPRVRPNAVSSDWVGHLPTPEEQDAFKKRLIAASDVFDVLRNIVQVRYNQLASSKAGSDYSTPNWELMRAHKDGQLEELENIWKLIPFESNTTTTGV